MEARTNVKMKTVMAAIALSFVSISTPLFSHEIRAERSIASEAESDSDKVIVTYVSTGNDPLAFRATDGSGLGYSTGPVRLTMMIDVATAKASVDPTTGQVDGPTLLRNLSPQKGEDGKTYYAMRVLQPITMQDGRTIMPETDSQASQVLLNVDDLQLSKVVFPVAAGASADASAPVKSAAQALDNSLASNGLTARSLPAPDVDTSDDTVLADDNSAEDEDDTQIASAGTSIINGLPFPQRFLSAPVCSCQGGTCGVSSGFGWRAKKVRGKWRTFKTATGYGSKNHKGLDINAHQKDGSGVMSAAKGCIKIPAKNGRLLHKRGDPILPSEIKMGGYGNTLLLTHGNGFDTQYSHLKTITKGLYWGQCFERGVRIATMGHTGSASGPHLHFGVLKNGVPVNPKNFLLGDDGDGTLNGSFLGQSCKAPKRYPTLDAEMRDDLRAGVAAFRARNSARSNGAAH